MPEYLEELEPSHLALLDMYRDALGPTPEVEERVLARIQAQASVEAELASDDRSLLGADESTKENEQPSVQPLTAAVVALVAFAAGVALTWGFRGELARSLDEAMTGTEAAMTTDDRSMGRIAATEDAGGACDPVAVPAQDRAWARSQDGSADPIARTPADQPDPADARRQASDASRWEPLPSPAEGERRGRSVLRQRTVASAPWATPAPVERGSGATPAQAPREPQGIGGGYFGPSTGSAPRAQAPASGVPTPGPASTSATGRGAASAEGGRGPRPSAPTSDGPSAPTGDGGRPDGPQPRPPTPPPPDTPEPLPHPDADPPEPQPHDPEEDPLPDDGGDAGDDPEDCEITYDDCVGMAMQVCDEMPDLCDDLLNACDAEYQTCVDPALDPVQDCLQEYGDCYMDVDAQCAEEMPMPAGCDMAYAACDEALELCTSEYQGVIRQHEEEDIDAPDE